VYRITWSSARAHVRGKDDLVVRVKPMLSRGSDWREYLGTGPDSTDTDLLRLHIRTGRPLGSPGFIRKLEARVGRRLAPQRRGPKPKTNRRRG
jgi:putative transposase